MTCEPNIVFENLAALYALGCYTLALVAFVEFLVGEDSIALPTEDFRSQALVYHFLADQFVLPELRCHSASRKRLSTNVTSVVLGMAIEVFAQALLISGHKIAETAWKGLWHFGCWHWIRTYTIDFHVHFSHMSHHLSILLEGFSTHFAFECPFICIRHASNVLS